MYIYRQRMREMQRERDEQKANQIRNQEIDKYLKELMETRIERSNQKIGVNDLNDECLELVFSQMTLKQKFSVQRVSKRWKRLIEHHLQQQKAFIFYSSSHKKLENHLSFDDYEGHNAEEEISNEFQDLKLEWIADNCPEIKSISLNTYIVQQDLEWMQTRFPMTECLKIKDKPIAISNGLSLGNAFAERLKSLSINCRDITVKALPDLVSSLPKLQELEIISYYHRLDFVFNQLIIGLKSIALNDCRGFDENAVQALSCKSANTLISLSYHSNDNVSQQFLRVCNLFPMLRKLHFGEFRPKIIACLKSLVRLTHLQDLRLSFDGRLVNWAQRLADMQQIRKLDIHSGQVTGPLLYSINQRMPSIQSLTITISRLVFRCTCTPNNLNACQQCLQDIIKQLSDLKHLQKLGFNSNGTKSRAPLKQLSLLLKTIINGNNHAFSKGYSSLRLVSINWQRFPRSLKKPLYHGMESLAKRNPERLHILQIGSDLCRCHNPYLRSGWLSSIGRSRLQVIPSNLKFKFFKN